MRRFAGIDLGRAPAPDETTILNFRHLLEAHELCGQMLDTVNRYLESKGIQHPYPTGPTRFSLRHFLNSFKECRDFQKVFEVVRSVLSEV